MYRNTSGKSSRSEKEATTMRKSPGLVKNNNAALLAALVNASEDAILSKTLAGIITSWNPAAEKIFGYSAKEIIGKPITILFPPDRLQEEEAILERLVRGVATEHFDTVRLRKNGTPIDVSVSVSPISIGGARVTGASTIARDITSRKQAETRSQDSEARFRAVFNNTLVGILLVSSDGQIIQCNPAMSEMLGYSEQELVKVSFRDITHPDDLDSSVFLFKEMSDGRKYNYSYEKRYVRKDGSLLSANVSVSEVRDANGLFRFAIAVIDDRTGQKRIEAQLIQAQKMETVGRLAGGIAHDFNNLLAIIIGFSELIESDLTPDSEAVVYVAKIQEAANRAAAVTRQLLAFARRQLSMSKVVSPNDRLLSFTALLQPLLKPDVELTFLPGDMLGNVEIDPSHLEQIVMNLAVNARDAMPQGGKLTIKTESVTFSDGQVIEGMSVFAGDSVRVSVSDTGIGMPEDVMSQIFEPFFTTKDSSKGSGLGLATVYGLVKQANGFITAHSQVGVGSTFDVYLPVVDAALLSPGHSQTADVPGGGELLLVVDDEPLMRELTVKALRAAGYRVLSAENGADALRVLSSNPGLFALVVTDAIMPVMGGRELTERLRLQQPDIRVLVASGSIEEIYTNDYPPPKGVRFLQKPFASRTLLESVHGSLSGEGN